MGEKPPLETVWAFLEEQGVVEDPLYSWKVPGPAAVAIPPPPTRNNPDSRLTAAGKNFPAPKTTTGAPQTAMESLKKAVSQCIACGLGQRRRQFVAFGGNAHPALMVLTDYPEFYDEQKGRYFTDEPGELLRRMLLALDVPWERVWFSGALKCHSPVNLGARLDPYRVCIEHLKQEVALLAPPAILALGEVSYRLLFNPPEPFEFASVRGKNVQWQGVAVRPTHHLRDLLCEPVLKKESWEDLKDLKGRFP